MQVRIEILGRPALVLPDGSRVERFPTRKAAALLGYLALESGKPQPRERLTDVFWPDVEPASGRNSLNVALNALRVYLGEALRTDRTYVCLNAELVVTDLHEYLQVSRPFDPDQLLAGFYDDFVITERERLKAVLAGAALMPSPAATAPNARQFVPGGAVPLEAPFYIARSTDEQFFAALLRGDATILLKGAHEVGKTSLLARGARAARSSGSHVALTDLATLPGESADSFFRALAESLADVFGLGVAPEESWSESRSPSMNLERFIRRQVLEKTSVPVLWVLDEVDRLFELPFGPDLFRLFRSWHNRRSLEPDSPWGRLTLVIAYATEAQLFLTDLHQSPFNVGTRLNLADFTASDTAVLNTCFGSPLRTTTELSALREWVGGQPHLNHIAFYVLSGGVPLTEILAEALNPDGLFGTHLRRLTAALTRNTALMEAVRGLLAGVNPLAPEVFYRLRAAGVLTGEAGSEAQFRCRLYRDWFAHLLEA